MAEHGDAELSEFGAHDSQRKQIARASRLHWFHWIVLGFSLVVTIGATLVTKAQIDDKAEEQFERQSEQAVSLVIERLEKYEGGLWGGVAAIEANGGDMTYEEWQVFADSLDLDERYPGINGIGVIHHVPPAELDGYLSEQREQRPDYEVFPPHEESVFLPISYVEPAAPNAAAVGLDMAHEQNRYDGIKRAREFGVAQITGPIVLVQDEQSTPGFLFFAPWYDGGDPVDVRDRRAQFAGSVYAPFVVQKLMDGALDKTERDIGISIRDSDTVLYDEHTDDVDDFDPDPLYREQVRVPVFGRQWTFDIWSTKSFRAATSNNEPLTILAGGLLLDALLLLLFTSLTRANRRALVFADEVTEELREKSSRLETSNAELERFAYVASHDLKTPLRGIGNITEFLEEDLADYLASDAADPGVARNLARISEQSARMNALIDGILDYSRIGGDAGGSIETVNIPGLLDRISADLGVPRAQITHTGTAVFNACAAVYFEQVIQNLVANAVLHHNDLPHLQINVSIDTSATHHTIRVSDNGPGIAPQHHERIFQVFQRLEASGTGTGIGLSIVKKIVENQGCSIELDSDIGAGATFTFAWPVTGGPLVTPPTDDTADVDEVDKDESTDESTTQTEATWAVH